jgi:hypothetical protein
MVDSSLGLGLSPHMNADEVLLEMRKMHQETDQRDKDQSSNLEFGDEGHEALQNYKKKFREALKTVDNADKLLKTLE